MRKNQNKPLKVYLSKSLQLSDTILEPIRKSLIGSGFEVTEKAGTYSDKDLKEADFVVLVPMENPLSIERNRWKTFVGKGQYSEVRHCYMSNKPCFIYHSMADYGDIKMSKLHEPDSIFEPLINDSNDWTYKYGTVPSYVLGSEPVDLYPFIEGYFHLYGKQYSLTSNECYPANYKLLLLT
jgi:hypothetical protein